MSQFTPATAQNGLLALAPAWLSLHSAYDPAGGFEVSTARAPAVYEAIPQTGAIWSGGLFGPAPLQVNISYITSTGLYGTLSQDYIPIQVPADTVVSWLGLWDNSNNFLGMTPLPPWQYPSAFTVLSETRLIPFVVDSTNLSLLRCGNGPMGITNGTFQGGSLFNPGDTVVVWEGPLPGETFPPAGSYLQEGVIYTVLNVIGDGLQLDDGSGNARTYSFGGAGWLQSIAQITIPYQGVYYISFSALFK